MKKLFVLYFVPYAFLSMYGDAKWGVLWFYLLMITVFSALYVLFSKEKCYLFIFWGNGLSLISSLIFTHFFRWEKWGWYFKPFSDRGLIITVSAVIFIVQLIAMTVKKCKG